MASDSLPTPPSVTPTPAAAAAAASSSQPADPPSPALAAPGAQPALTQAEMLESLLQQILASNSPSALAGTLRNAMGTSEAREEGLANTTSAGADPLEALDVVQHTVGALFILYVVGFTFFPPPPTATAFPSFFFRAHLRTTCSCSSPVVWAALSWILNGDRASHH